MRAFVDRLLRQDESPDPQRYQVLWQDHLFAQAVASFLFTFLILYAYNLAGDGKSPVLPIPGGKSIPMPEFAGMVPLTFSAICLGLSIFLGIAALIPKLRKSLWLARFVGWLSVVSIPLLLASFIVGWVGGIGTLLDPTSLLFSIFFWAGFLWFLAICGYSINVAWRHSWASRISRM